MDRCVGTAEVPVPARCVLMPSHPRIPASPTRLPHISSTALSRDGGARRDVDHEVEHLRARTQHAEELARSLRTQVERSQVDASQCRRQMEVMQVCVCEVM